MINWKYSIIGAVLVVVLEMVLMFVLVNIGLGTIGLFTWFIPGIVVGYLVNNGYKNGAKNGIIAGLIGGFLVGILQITFDSFNQGLWFILLFAFSTAGFFAFLGAVGGIIGSLIRDKITGSVYDDPATAAVSGNLKGMINWRFSIIGAVLVVVLGVLQFYLIRSDLIWGALVSGIVVGYLVNNGFKNGIINGFIAGLLGGLMLGIFFYIIYVVPHTSNFDTSPLFVAVGGLSGMGVIFSFLGTVGGLVGSLLKKLYKKMNSINQ